MLDKSFIQFAGEPIPGYNRLESCSSGPNFPWDCIWSRHANNMNTKYLIDPADPEPASKGLVQSTQERRLAPLKLCFPAAVEPAKRNLSAMPSNRHFWRTDRHLFPSLDETTLHSTGVVRVFVIRNDCILLHDRQSLWRRSIKCTLARLNT